MRIIRLIMRWNYSLIILTNEMIHTYIHTYIHAALREQQLWQGSGCVERGLHLRRAVPEKALLMRR